MGEKKRLVVKPKTDARKSKTDNKNRSAELRKSIYGRRLKIKDQKMAKTFSDSVFVPESVGRWLDDEHIYVLDNLTRGLRVEAPLVKKAKLSLHKARKIVIKKMLAYTYTDSEICLELDLTGNELHNYKRALYKEEIESLRKSTAEEQFVQYRHNQMEVIKDLDVLIEKFKSGTNSNALANALKVKFEILRDIAAKAQEMGFMEKKPEELKVIGEVDLAELSNDQMLSLVQRQQDLVNRVAAGELTSVGKIKKALRVVSNE